MALSDLYELYQKELEKHPKAVPKILELQEDESRRYLFLGTSFSEHHIANAIAKLMSASSSNITIYSVPAKIDRQYNFELAEKIKNFKLSNLIRYPNNHDHKELVIILRQLARDLQYGFWNNDLLMQLFFEYQADFYKYQNVIEAVNKLKDDKDELLVRIDNNVSSQEECLILKNWKEVQCLIAEINTTFYRPEWSKCFIPDAYLQEMNIGQIEEMLQPLGSSIYILLEKEENLSDVTLLGKVRKQIKNYCEKYNCRLIVIVMDDIHRKKVWSSFVNRYANGHYSHIEKTFARDIVTEVLQSNLSELIELINAIFDESVNKDINNVDDNNKVLILRQEEMNGNNL